MAASAVVFQGPEAWPKLNPCGGKLSGPEQLVKVGNGELDGRLMSVPGWGWSMFFKGDFLRKFSGKIGKVRKWKELKSWCFLWLFSCQYVSTWSGGRQLPTFAQQWNRKREVCSIFWHWHCVFWYFLVLGRRIKRTFAPSEPYQPWSCPICGTFGAQTQQGRSLWWIWWWIKDPPHQSIAWDSFIYS